MKRRVLYIMGYARSGSTILSCLLGSHSKIFCGGELVNIEEVSRSPVEHCSCGALASECPFWRSVRLDWQKSVGAICDAHCDTPMQLRKVRYLRPPRNLNEFEGWAGYSLQNDSLFKTLQKHSGADFVLDSSKSPMRAWALSQIPGLDVYVVHLVRDVRGVAFSRNREWLADPKAGIGTAQPSIPVRRTIRDWVRLNIRANQVRSRLGRRAMLLRYEDLVSEPSRAVQRIGELIGIDTRELSSQLEQGASMSAGHQIAGNRVRMKREVRLKSDMTWRCELPLRNRLFIWFLASPLACLYGYTP